MKNVKLCLNCFEIFKPKYITEKKCPTLNCNHALIDVDNELAPIIVSLNKKGFHTTSCKRESYNNNEDWYEWSISFRNSCTFDNLPTDFYIKDKTVFFKFKMSANRQDYSSYIKQKTTEFLTYIENKQLDEESIMKQEELLERKRSSNKEEEKYNNIAFLSNSSHPNKYNVHSISRRAAYSLNKDFILKSPLLDDSFGTIVVGSILQEKEPIDFSDNYKLYYGIVQEGGNNLNVILSSLSDVDRFFRHCQASSENCLLSVFKGRKIKFETVIFTLKEVHKTEQGNFVINANNCTFL